MPRVTSLDDLDKDEYVRLVLADAHDDVSEEQAASLRSEEGVREWRDTLHEIAVLAQAKLTRLNAELLAKEQECRLKGPRGKSEFFQFKAQTDKDRAKTSSFHHRILVRYREAKAVLHEASQNDDQGLKVLIEGISTRLDGIEKLLKELLRRTT